MPELPEIVNFKHYVGATSLHHTISSVKVPNPNILSDISPESIKSKLTDTHFKSASHHGKYLFLQTGNSHELVLHFGMTGQPVYYKNENDKPDYVRFFITFDDGSHLAFDCMRMLGEITLIDDHEEFIEQKDLGPDALREVDSIDIFKELLGNKRGMIKSALMDQSLLAGIGNECSDEILYQSGIYPKTKVQALDEENLGALFHNMHAVLEIKIDSNLEIQNLPDSYILRHRSDGEECPRCGGTIQQIKVSGRNGYYCSDCQPKLTT